jgi:hypothetical protein
MHGSIPGKTPEDFQENAGYPDGMSRTCAVDASVWNWDDFLGHGRFAN